ASRECPTCLEQYDHRDHRVRMVQCGHSQCTACLRAQFMNGRITCCTCRATHTYQSVDSIPINYIAENMKEEMDKLKNQEAAPLALPKLHKGICEEHASYNLFWCNTHHKWICSHCSVTEHPRGECEVIAIRKQFEKDKVSTKSKIYEQIKQLLDTKNNVDFSIDEVGKQKKEENKNIKKMKEEMEELKKQIVLKESYVSVLHTQHTKLQAITQECEEKKSKLEKVLDHFDHVSTFKELSVENTNTESLINVIVNWRKGLNEDKDLSQLSKTNLPKMLEHLKKTTNPQEKKTIMNDAKKVLLQRLKKTKVSVKKEIGNSTYFSSIEERQGCIVVNSLQNNRSLATDSSVFEYDDVMRLTTRPPSAFLQLSHHGTNLGCLHIRLDGLPGCVQQYQELATGSSGRGSYRGARFGWIYNKGEPGERV
ncbi:unnamed protein product, partial [Meganyctiphanes norvegica]